MKILVIILIIILIIFLGIMFLGWIFSAPVYRGPVSDHFDGKKFINPGGVEAKGFKDLMKWMRNREAGRMERNKGCAIWPGAGRQGGRRFHRGDLCQSFHFPDPDAGPEHPDRSGLERKGQPGFFLRARKGCALRGSASKTCRKSISSC